MKNHRWTDTLAGLTGALILAGLGLVTDNGTGDGALSQLEVAPVVELAPRDVDLALCLDTSGSMEGLIESAKQRLWALVNDLALAEPTPRLRVALLTYGTPSYPEEDGWVLVRTPLTTDLDLVSQRLFELSTNGGDEYVARVVNRAATALEWSDDPAALKMIVVAGNETAEQDPQITLEAACGGAIAKGIVVNSLYCAQYSLQAAPQPAAASTNAVPPQGPMQQQGQASQQQVQGPQQVFGNTQHAASGTPAVAPTVDPIAETWRKVALLSDGAYAAIDASGGTVVIETPFDEEMAALSTALNTTYVPYGAGGQLAWGNQAAQDCNAVSLNNEAAASRAVAKSGKLYRCSWDLIDALDDELVRLEDVMAEDLPEALRELSPEELRAHLETQRAARAKISADIATLAERRDAWLAERRRELAADESRSFDFTLRRALRDQAAARGFRFTDAETDTPTAEETEGPSGEAEAIPNS